MNLVIISFTYFSIRKCIKLYQAIHWRYDRRDFLSESRCAKFAVQKDLRKRNRRNAILTYEMACELLQPVFSDPTAFAVDIYRELQKQNLSKIYLAAPPAEIAFISNLRDKLKKRGIKVLTFEDAENFIVENYFDCSHFRVSLIIAVLLTHKEVCSILDTVIIDSFSYTKMIHYRSLSKKFAINQACLLDH